MLTGEELAALRTAIADDPDRTGLLATLRQRVSPLLSRQPPIPRVKALLSRDGGRCPDDGSPLTFDPWSPDRHACPRCGNSFTGDRHHRHWARAQHLWLAERMADLALLAALDQSEAAAEKASELITAYAELYFELPNQDNVLGPTHLFFSTYLESLWISSFLAAAFILRETGTMSPHAIAAVESVADEAANLIGEFNEGFSNRQTWHAAALTAIAAWFGDEELARTSVESRTGLLGHLTDGFGSDGFWWEGENYHLFALRGLMHGIHWARALGFDLLGDPTLRAHFREAVLAPSRSALPDFTYPARRDSRYGVSLAEPASLELFEVGRGWLGEDAELDSWLGALHGLPPRRSGSPLYDAWLHHAGDATTIPPARTALSWWALTAMAGTPAQVAEPWQPASVLLTDQGLAVLRRDDRYVSIECGREIGGHGHPDRLHLTLHQNGVHWLPDPGTGSYVEPVLAWYRSALAHNAPRTGGVNAGGADAWCDAFAGESEWEWCRARAGRLTRNVISGPGYLLDVLDLDGSDAVSLDLPWHFVGKIEVAVPGSWEPAPLEHPFVSAAEKFFPAGNGAIEIRISAPTVPAVLRATCLAEGAELLRAVGPGLPGQGEPLPFLLLRAVGSTIRWVTVLSPGDSSLELRDTGEALEVTVAGRTTRLRIGETALAIEHDGKTVTLAGQRTRPPKHKPFFQPANLPAAEAVAPMIPEPPALDGTLDGFDTSEPMALEGELQYRRSEDPYDPETFAARAWANWDAESLYLAVEVTKPEIVFRRPDAPPLELDNDPEDINSDGLEVFLSFAGEVAGVLVVPLEAGGVYVRPIGEAGSDSLRATGGWTPTETGYLVTLRLDDRRFAVQGRGARLGFDILVNEMRPDRHRRAGQLVWGGGGGWIYLQSDRHDSAQFGMLLLG